MPIELPEGLLEIVGKISDTIRTGFQLFTRSIPMFWRQPLAKVRALSASISS